MNAREPFGATLLRSGLARVYTEGTSSREGEYLRLQQHAQEEGIGLWSECSAEGHVEPGQECEPSYPDVCIPPPPPDLDCGEIPYRGFTVLPPDPHRFDGDRDGIGCE